MKFPIIYCDPPWTYGQKGLSGAAEKHYRTLSENDLYQLNVGEIAMEDCVLFLWTTFPQLAVAMRLIREWGFEYKTVGFVWLKKNRKSDSFFFGLGFWTRGNAEVCLIATKGHPRRISNKVSQLIISPIEAHSKKPDMVREKIVELMGDIPRVELFARQCYEGWICVGNEIDGLDIREALEHLKEMEGEDEGGQTGITKGTGTGRI